MVSCCYYPLVPWWCLILTDCSANSIHFLHNYWDSNLSQPNNQPWTRDFGCKGVCFKNGDAIPRDVLFLWGNDSRRPRFIEMLTYRTNDRASSRFGLESAERFSVWVRRRRPETETDCGNFVKGIRESDDVSCRLFGVIGFGCLE